MKIYRQQIMIILLFILSIPCVSQDKEKIYYPVEKMPSFPGGEEALFKFIRKNFKYPNDDLGYIGYTTIRFIVTEGGKIKNPMVLSGPGLAMDKEALRIISLMPDWIPAMLNDKTVNAYYILPVLYKLMHE